MQHAIRSMAPIPGTSEPGEHRTRVGSRRGRSLLVQAPFGLMAASGVAVFFLAVAHHVYRFEFKPLAAFCLPVLAVFFAFTSLLYMRGRSLAPGRDQFRTLFAAERSMRATLHYLLGIVVGTSLYGLFRAVSFTFDPAQPSAEGLWLLLFLAPYALMQIGLLLFISAVWVILPQVVRPHSALAVARRIGHESAKR
jgi:hypothetical protein